jgi:DNA modification methylase
VTPFVQDSDFTLYVGDALEVLREMPDESVHCVVTSPPYWGLRDYGTGAWDGGDPDCDHMEELRSSSYNVGFNERWGNAAGDKKQEERGKRPFKDACGKCGATRVDQQLGLEPTPDEYVRNMVDVFREVRRVLRRDGTCWVNLGDSYAQGHGGSSTEGNYTMRKAARGDATTPERREPLRCEWCGWLAPGYTALADHVATARHKPDDDGNYRRKGGVRNVVPGLKPKDLCGIPWRVAFALQADGWYLRSDIIWAKPNPMPESVTDRPTKAHEYVFLLTRSPRYFFDQEAVRESAAWERWGDQTNGKHEGQQTGAGWIGSASKEELQRRSTKTKKPDGWATHDGGHGSFHREGREKGAENHVEARGRNIRSVWEIATQPYPEAHFATFPEALPDRCIRAGTSERGCCPVCGAPWERVIEFTEESVYAKMKKDTGLHWTEMRNQRSERGVTRQSDNMGGNTANAKGTVPSLKGRDRKHNGWRPSCNCTVPHPGDEFGTVVGLNPDPAPCTVLDPFMGSGTVALVARRLGRRSIGVELNDSYAALCARRLQQLSLFAGEPEPTPVLSKHRGLTGGAYSPPGQSPHSNARGKP